MFSWTRELTEDRLFLRQVAHTFASTPIHGHSGDVTIFEDNTPGVRSDEPNDHVEGCCLTGSVGTEQPDDFAAFYIDVDAIYHRAAAVNLDEFVCGEKGLVVLLRGGGEWGWCGRNTHHQKLLRIIVDDHGPAAACCGHFAAAIENHDVLSSVATCMLISC